MDLLAEYQISENIQVLRKKGHLLLIPQKGAKMFKIGGPPADVVNLIFRGATIVDIEKLIAEKYSELYEPKEAVQEILSTLLVRGVVTSQPAVKTKLSMGEKIGSMVTKIVFNHSRSANDARFSKYIFIFCLTFFLSAFFYSIQSLIEFLNHIKLSGLHFSGVPSTIFSTISMIALWVFGHELSHALVAGRMGVRISSVSIGRFGGLIPLPFMDIRRAWVIDRWNHGMIALAGPLFDVFFMAVILTYAVTVEHYVPIVFLVSVFGVIMVLSNSNPFVQSDMALVFSAIAEDPELRLKAVSVVDAETDSIRNVKLYRSCMVVYFFSFTTVVLIIAYQLWIIFWG